MAVSHLLELGTCSVKEFCYFTGLTTAVINGLQKKGLIDIKYAWANMEEDLYFKIQEAISDQLKNKNNYKVDLKDGKENICLPSNKLLAEFIIWNQEKINEIKRERKKLDESYEKLCIDLKI